MQAGGGVVPAEGPQFDTPAGLALGEVFQDGGVQRAPEGGERAGPQQPRLLGGGVGDGRDAVVPVVEEPPGQRVQDGAGGGERDLAPVAPEQLGAQRGF